MSKKIKTIIAIGGTGGHVFPGLHLGEHLEKSGHFVEYVTDKRGYKFLNRFNNLIIKILPSSRLSKKNIFIYFLSLMAILYSVLRSIIFLLFNRPKIIFGMGGYASFPICIAATILKIKFIIYENNLIIGKANKYLLPFARQIFVSYRELEGIPEKFNYKIREIGNIINKTIINYNQNQKKIRDNKKIKILILGGSQAAKIFAETLPNIFKRCSNEGVSLEIFQHCMQNQEKQLSLFYKEAKIKFETFTFSENLIEYFSKVNLAITRSGASILAELTNCNIPFVSVPLPTAADNHQLKNAIYYQQKNYSFLIEEKDLKTELYSLIKEIYNNNELLENIINKQRQHSDKNVYNNINKNLKNTFNEKN